jgi:hypothetical protein
MKTYGEVAVCGGEWLDLCRICFNLLGENVLGADWLGGWVGPSSGLIAVTKRTQLVHLVFSVCDLKGTVEMGLCFIGTIDLLYYCMDFVSHLIFFIFQIVYKTEVLFNTGSGIILCW